MTIETKMSDQDKRQIAAALVAQELDLIAASPAFSVDTREAARVASQVMRELGSGQQEDGNERFEGGAACPRYVCETVLRRAGLKLGEAS